MKALALLMVLPLQVQAQDFSPYADSVPACLNIVEPNEGVVGCIGDASSECMEQQPSGHTTSGMARCLIGERDAWDVLLNEEYQQALIVAKRMDDADLKTSPEFAVRVDQLRVAQRAWIVFRDANCSVAYGRWGSGSIRRIAGPDCQMQMTAERTIALKNYNRGLE